MIGNYVPGMVRTIIKTENKGSRFKKRTSNSADKTAKPKQKKTNKIHQVKDPYLESVNK